MFDNKKTVSLIMSRRKGSETQVKDEKEAPGSEIDPGLKAVAEDILRAIDQKSVIDLAKALKQAHEVCDQYEHEEGPHTNEDQE